MAANEENRDHTAGLTVALAEYDALREEFKLRMASAERLVALNFTATAAIFGVAFTQKVPLTILLAVPLTSAALGFSWLEHMAQIAVIGKYIASQLWPFVRLASGASEDLPSWEMESGSWNSTIPIRGIIAIYALAAFVAPPTVALIAVPFGGFTTPPWRILWLLAIVFSVALAAIAGLFSIRTIAPHFVRPLATESSTSAQQRC